MYLVTIDASIRFPVIRCVAPPIVAQCSKSTWITRKALADLLFESLASIALNLLVVILELFRSKGSWTCSGKRSATRTLLPNFSFGMSLSRA